MKIAVAGAGPAGAGFAAEMARLGQGGQVTIFERDLEYRKPCGDVVLEDVLRETPVPPPILNRVRRFELRVKGSPVFEAEYPRPLWYVIDKPAWVRSLRAYAVDRGARLIHSNAHLPKLVGEYDVIVDARGPFANNGLSKLTITRAIVEHPVDPEGVLIDFDPIEMGFLWVFPHEKHASNIGLAYKGERSPHKRLLKLLEKEYGSPHLIRMDTTIITIDQPPREPPARPPIYPIGEAAGLVHPLSGEGIRPAHLHGIHLARRLAETPDPRLAYRLAWRDLWDFVSQMRFQKLLMDLLDNLPNSDDKLQAMRLLAPRLYHDFLQDRIGLGDVVDSMLRNPRLLMIMVPALIRWAGGWRRSG